MLSHFLDGTIIILLLVTIAYAVRLNARLKLIKNEKQDFANNIKAFHDATQQAIIAVEELHVKGEEICKLIDEKIKRAQIAGDEIDFLTSRATKKIAEIKPAPQPTHGKFGVNSIAEAELLKALRNREFKEALLAN